jgi:small basic protein
LLLEEIRNIKSEKSDLRKFGITIGIVLCLLSGLLWWKGRDTYLIFSVIAAAFLLTGIVVPAILKPLQKVWMTIAVVMGWFMTRVILSVLFYVVFTSIGIMSRLLGKKFLDIDFREKKESYWIKRESGLFDKSRYEKQF